MSVTTPSMSEQDDGDSFVDSIRNNAGLGDDDTDNDGYRATTTYTSPDGQKTRVVQDVDHEDETTSSETRIVGPDGESRRLSRTVIDEK